MERISREAPHLPGSVDCDHNPSWRTHPVSAEQSDVVGNGIAIYLEPRGGRRPIVVVRAGKENGKVVKARFVDSSATCWE